MKTIWKYELKPGENNIELPADSVPLSVQVQNEKPVMWCLVDTDNLMINRTFIVYGTGEKIDPELSLKYIGTFQLDWMVFHLFKEIIS